VKVFLSWSGELSKSYAEVLSKWLPCVLQAIEPYFSANDIDKGSRWASEISKELEACAVGVICLTRTNLNAPWIMFEAGALTKALTVAKVTPLLFDGLSPTDVQGPLSQFQSAVFSKGEIKKLILSLNKSLGASALDEPVLNESFDMWWPKLNQAISDIPTNEIMDDEFYQRDERSLLKETLQLTRAMYFEDDRYKFVEPILLKKIDCLKLSDNTQAILRAEGIWYMGDLVSRTEIELLATPEVDKNTLTEIKEALAIYGLTLGVFLRNWPPTALINDIEN